MAALVSSERNRACRAEDGPETNDQGPGMTLPFGTDRAMPREAWGLLHVSRLIRVNIQRMNIRTWKENLENMAVGDVDACVLGVLKNCRDRLGTDVLIICDAEV